MKPYINNSTLTPAPMAPRKSYMARGAAKLRKWYEKPEAGTRARLIREADIAVSRYTRRRDGRCVTCGTTENLTASHYFKRGYHSTRWNEQNVHTQCRRCNKLHNTNPFPYRAYMVKLYGEDFLLELFAIRNQRGKVTDAEIEEITDEFKLKLRRLAA